MQVLGNSLSYNFQNYWAQDPILNKTKKVQNMIPRRERSFLCREFLCLPAGVYLQATSQLCTKKLGLEGFGVLDVPPKKPYILI